VTAVTAPALGTTRDDATSERNASMGWSAIVALRFDDPDQAAFAGAPLPTAT
jgi:hypothetical protein